MNKNYLSIELGGKIRGIKLDLGAKEIAAELFKEEGSVSSDVKAAAIILYSGMVSVCEIKGEDPDFTIEDVRKWARRIDMDQAKEIVAVWNKAYGLDKGETPVEGSSDTQLKTA